MDSSKPDHEFVERTYASQLLDFCLDDLTYKERDALESKLNLAACLQQALLPRHDSSDPGWQICYHYAPTPSKLISECLSDHRNFQSRAKQVDHLTLLVIRTTG